MTDEWDSTDPLVFELWVLEKLRAAGFRVARTPRSRDGGADGIALAPEGSAIPALVIQCKLVQSHRLLGQAAIEEAIASLVRYQLPEGTRAMVVTTAHAFSRSASNYGREHGAILIARDQLETLSDLANRIIRRDPAGG